MKKLIRLLILSMAALFASGCCMPPPASEGIQTMSPTSTAPESSIGKNMIPQPTDVIPPFYSITVQLGKNTVSIDPYISISFRGGPGQEFTQSMHAVVFRSDGSTESGTVAYPQVGSEIILSGTTGTDRVVVDITLVTGETYRAYDALVPFRNL